MGCSQKHLLGTADYEEYPAGDPMLSEGTQIFGAYPHSSNMNYNMRDYVAQPVTPPELANSNDYLTLPSMSLADLK